MVPFVPKDPPQVTMRRQSKQLHAALASDTTLHPLVPTDLINIVPPHVVRRDIQRLSNLGSRLNDCRESVDLVHQLFTNTRTGRPSPAPFHASGELERTPTWRNKGKGGGFCLSLDYMLLGACLKQTRACTPEQVDEVESLLRFFEPLDVECRVAACRWAGRANTRMPPLDDASKASVIERIQRAMACFGPEGKEVMSAPELDLPDRSTSYIRSVIDLLRRTRGSAGTGDPVEVATSPRRQDLLDVLNELE